MVDNWLQTTTKINMQQLAELEHLRRRKEKLEKGIAKIK